MQQPLFAFFGTPKFGVDVLNALEKNGLLPALIVTAPDKPRGRKLEITPSPVKQWALERGIQVITPATLKTPLEHPPLPQEFFNTDWDVFIVAAYAKLIPKNILDIPKHGCLNVHPSLLPKLRGPSPALTAILNDMRETGVTVMQMSERMDAGPIVAQAKVELDEEVWPPKGSEFEELLATEGGNLLAEALPLWIQNKITPVEQNESEATFSRKFVDADALIDLNGEARKNLCKIRAFDKGPRAYMLVDGKRVIITEAKMVDGKLEILKVIPEGKKEMDAKFYFANL
jgi:methionyl-tRNA formyltransferase